MTVTSAHNHLFLFFFKLRWSNMCFFSKKINKNSDKAEAPSRTIHPVLLVLLSRQPVWDDNLMVQVESRADVAAGQHDFLSQVAAVILEVGRGAGWSQVVKWICLISSDPERKMWRKWRSVNVNVPAALSSRSQTLASYSICFHWLSSYVMHLFSFQQCEILKDGLREQGRSLAWAKSMPCRIRIHTRKVAFPSGWGIGLMSDENDITWNGSTAKPRKQEHSAFRARYHAVYYSSFRKLFPLPQNTRIVLVQADLNASVGWFSAPWGGSHWWFFVFVFVYLIVLERNIQISAQNTPCRLTQFSSGVVSDWLPAKNQKTGEALCWVVSHWWDQIKWKMSTTLHCPPGSVSFMHCVLIPFARLTTGLPALQRPGTNHTLLVIHILLYHFVYVQESSPTGQKAQQST